MRRIGEIIDELDLKGKNDELVKELVDAVDQARHPHAVHVVPGRRERSGARTGRPGRERRRAGLALDRLEATDGLQGVAQRDAKKSLQEAAQPAAAASPSFSVPGGGAGGFGGGELAKYGRGGVPGLRAANTYRDADTDREITAGGIQNAGRETLYKRGKLWIATNAQKFDLEKDDAKIKRVKRFTDEYFDIVRANTQDENAVLASQQEGEELLVVLRGQAYRFE